jgi:hypothetical protein
MAPERLLFNDGKWTIIESECTMMYSPVPISRRRFQRPVADVIKL